MPQNSKLPPQQDPPLVIFISFRGSSKGRKYIGKKYQESRHNAFFGDFEKIEAQTSSFTIKASRNGRTHPLPHDSTDSPTDGILGKCNELCIPGENTATISACFKFAPIPRTRNGNYMSMVRDLIRLLIYINRFPTVAR